MTEAFQIPGDDGDILARLRAGRVAEEIARLRRALLIEPEQARYWHFLSLAHSGQANFALERKMLRRALTLTPRNAHMLTSLGLSRQRERDIAGAHAAFDQAIEHSPNFAAARYHRSLIELEAGHLSRGWTDYEYRFSLDHVPGTWRDFSFPVWNGRDSLDGKLLVWGEQSVSMQILFSSVLSEIDAPHGFIMECDPRIAPLIARAHPRAEVVARTDPPDPRLSADDIAAHIPLGRLCGFKRPKFVEFTQKAGYLACDAERAIDLMLDLAVPGNRTIGLLWRLPGQPPGGLTLDRLRPVLEIPNTTWISLEGPAAMPEIDHFGASIGIEIRGDHGIDPDRDMDGLAALISACDLVISIDHPVAHLAGALGRATWTLLPDRIHARWYWFSHHRLNPPVFSRWYSGTRLIWRHDEEAASAYITRLAELLRHASAAA